MRSKCYDDYLDERMRLSEKEIDTILAHGRNWALAQVLADGGVIVFPHTFMYACGSYIAAAVHAALDSGSDQVLALGVLHSTSDMQVMARKLEREKKDLSHLNLRAIYGPDLPNASHLVDEYCLLSFLFLWQEEIKRRNIKAPKLVLRYPYLVNRAPESMPNIAELTAVAKDSCIVATSDFCHHGAAYGHTGDDLIELGPKALQYAKESITDNLALLEKEAYDAYYTSCHAIKSDSFDVGTMISYIRKPLSVKLLDLTIVDASTLYPGNPAPSFVAASLVQFCK